MPPLISLDSGRVTTAQATKFHSNGETLVRRRAGETGSVRFILLAPVAANRVQASIPIFLMIYHPLVPSVLEPSPACVLRPILHLEDPHKSNSQRPGAPIDEDVVLWATPLVPAPLGANR
ncbi:hypothetical protein FRC07_001193 [Ceratobasidium sp. 392]|nr:hypothetical protein FRC07_001193 [Ceratobasidium sp. 392]